ncbi:OmpA family protein [Paenalcaligenes hominis]|uniref:OmpA family protein n=1 Tax=Paenalcaligenes hominis TaxID=643674 RepID=UPI00352405EF
MKIQTLCLSLLASLTLGACTTLSQVDESGRTQEPVFPERNKTTFDQGSFPNLANLGQVQPGLTRDQLYDLLGRPHYAEGFKVREWDYLFHFRTKEGLKSCQFKVLFDKDRIAQSFYWKPTECAELIDSQASTDEIAAAPFVLSADVGFAFGSASLTPAGLSQLQQMAAQLKQTSQPSTILITGHTDRIGAAQVNQHLSEQRAQAVRLALTNSGVPSQTMQAKGLGETQPVVFCDQAQQADLIACLAPNRRVEIQMQAAK